MEAKGQTGTAARFRISRRVLMSQLAALSAYFVAGVRAASQELIVPPPFKAGRYQFTVVEPQRMIPAARLNGLDGKTSELSKFRGKVTLINFWATWCPPCRTELPILDNLQATKGDRLHVLAVSIDKEGRKTVEPFVRMLNIRMPIYLDPFGKLAYSGSENTTNAPFALYGLPITYVIAGSGRVVGYIPGAAEWTSREGLAFLDYLSAQ